ncbi:MAG TPA: hypothetical protein VFX28_17765, partial [Methylomirabilota bacterium]|nr:hypothetical protein [Methylomirabilota bacterium]
GWARGGVASWRAGETLSGRTSMAEGGGGRSAKAGRPPREVTQRPQARRRRRSATAEVRKDTMLLQNQAGTRAAWPASRKKLKKR